MRDIKPTRWPIARGMVAPQWRWFYENPYVFCPFFSLPGYDPISREEYARTGFSRVITSAGPAVKADATSDLYTIGTKSASLTEISGACYAYWPTTPSGYDHHIVGAYQVGGAFPGWGWRPLDTYGTDAPNFWDGTAWRQSTTKISEGAIHLLGFTYSGGRVKFYIDGREDADVASVSSLPAYGGTKVLFSRADGTDSDYLASFIYINIVSDTWSAEQHAMLGRDPFGPLRMHVEPAEWYVAAAAGGGANYLTLLGVG